MIKKPGVTFFPTNDVIPPSRKTPTTSFFAFNFFPSFAFSKPIVFLSFIVIVWIQVSLFRFEVADLQTLSDCCRGFNFNALLEVNLLFKLISRNSNRSDP